MLKKGELTTQQIVILVIALVSFSVLIYFLVILNPGEVTNKQLCHNSVALIDKGKGIVGNLDCRTEYVCLSGGDSCEQFLPTSEIKIDSSSKEQVFKELANEMQDCWWMFGEGKIDYTSLEYWEEIKENFAQEDYVCAICSRIKFDKTIQKDLPSLSYSEFYGYLATNESGEKGQTYLRYLYGINSLSSLSVISQGQLKDFDFNKEKIDTTKDYLIITGMDPEPIVKDSYMKTYLVELGDIKNKTYCGAFDISKS